MLEYTSREVVQVQKQYDMLLASLEYCDELDKKDIYIELDKLEKNILNSTNEIYEEVYNKLASKNSSLIDEERERLSSIINLIENRIKFLNSEKQKHKKITNTVVEQPRILGELELSDYKRRLEIINKYKQNIKIKKELKREISILEEKEKVCLTKLKSNDKINSELEEKMQEILTKSFDAMNLYSLLERKSEIELTYKELSFAKEKAIENLELANKNSNNEFVLDCQKMLDSITLEYDKYFEKKMLLELLNIYDKKVENYDELIAKREKMQDIFMNIENSDFYKLVSFEMNKQYNTIKVQEEDVKLYREVISDLEKRREKIDSINTENNSPEFKSILDELIKNEKKRQEQMIQEQRKREYEERQRRLILENKRQEEMKRRQKLIEKEREKEEQKKKHELEKQAEIEEKINKIITEETREDVAEKTIPISTIESKSKTIHIPKEVVFDEEIVEKNKIENDKISNRDSLFESIYDEMKKKLEDENNNNKKVDNYLKKDQDDNDKKNDNKKDDQFSIPVIKNDNLVAKKIKDEVVDIEIKTKNQDNKKSEIFIDDVIFPDIPM